MSETWYPTPTFSGCIIILWPSGGEIPPFSTQAAMQCQLGNHLLLSGLDDWRNVWPSFFGPLKWGIRGHLWTHSHTHGPLKVRDSSNLLLIVCNNPRMARLDLNCMSSPKSFYSVKVGEGWCTVSHRLPTSYPLMLWPCSALHWLPWNKDSVAHGTAFKTYAIVTVHVI